MQLSELGLRDTDTDELEDDVLDHQRVAGLANDLRNYHVRSYLGEVMEFYAAYPWDDENGVACLMCCLYYEVDDGGESAVDEFYDGDYAIKTRTKEERQWCARKVLELIEYHYPSGGELQYVMSVAVPCECDQPWPHVIIPGIHGAAIAQLDFDNGTQTDPADGE